jgi:catechol 2,3-dioxygenase-like lactoylglutathione lyase family enzyme
MLYEALDTAFITTADLAPASAPYQKLGLHFAAEQFLPSLGMRLSALAVGESRNLFTALLLAGSEVTSPHPVDEPLRRGLQQPGLYALGLQVADMDAAVDYFAARDIEIIPQEVIAEDGAELCDLAWLPVAQQAATPLVLLHYPHSRAERHAAAQSAGELKHTFPLRRLDHLAAITHHDLDEKTRFWQEVLGIPQTGEINAGPMLIRQFQVGDVIMELLGPTSAESPLLQRPAGLISMMAWEVPNLDAVVQQARQAGFTVPDAKTGVLPGTRTATIPGPELAGVAMQLLEYV